MSILQRADCGCIGIVLEPDKFLCIMPCDNQGDDYSVTMFIRTIDEKNRGYIPLERKLEEDIIQQLMALVRRGNLYNDVRRLLLIRD